VPTSVESAFQFGHTAAGAVLVRPDVVLGWPVDALDRSTRRRCDAEVDW
jgi:hypothetical protein